MRKKPELLAPAGDMERLQMVLSYGADAVYLAGNAFGMRAFAGNFDRDELAQAVKLAHAKNVRVHVTGITNYEMARMWHELGASRVILARELSLREVAELCAKVPKELEVEAFVHGAMCVSVSGRCLLSNYMTGRDANRGACAQPCRYQYALMEEKRPGEYFPVFEEDGQTFILNSKDMCMIDHIPELMEAGLDSLKIEGRAKSSYYAAMTTAAYRHAIDAAAEDRPLDPIWRDEVEKNSHRHYSTGFWYGYPGQYTENGRFLQRQCRLSVGSNRCQYTVSQEKVMCAESSSEGSVFCCKAAYMVIGAGVPIGSPSIAVFQGPMRTSAPTR